MNQPPHITSGSQNGIQPRDVYEGRLRIRIHETVGVDDTSSLYLVAKLDDTASHKTEIKSYSGPIVQWSSDIQFTVTQDCDTISFDVVRPKGWFQRESVRHTVKLPVRVLTCARSASLYTPLGRPESGTSNRQKSQSGASSSCSKSNSKSQLDARSSFEIPTQCSQLHQNGTSNASTVGNHIATPTDTPQLSSVNGNALLQKRTSHVESVLGGLPRFANGQDEIPHFYADDGSTSQSQTPSTSVRCAKPAGDVLATPSDAPLDDGVHNATQLSQPPNITPISIPSSAFTHLGSDQFISPKKPNPPSASGSGLSGSSGMNPFGSASGSASASASASASGARTEPQTMLIPPSQQPRAVTPMSPVVLEDPSLRAGPSASPSPPADTSRPGQPQSERASFNQGLTVIQALSGGKAHPESVLRSSDEGSSAPVSANPYVSSGALNHSHTQKFLRTTVSHSSRRHPTNGMFTRHNTHTGGLVPFPENHIYRPHPLHSPTQPSPQLDAQVAVQPTIHLHDSASSFGDRCVSKPLSRQSIANANALLKTLIQTALGPGFKLPPGSIFFPSRPIAHMLETRRVMRLRHVQQRDRVALLEQLHAIVRGANEADTSTVASLVSRSSVGKTLRSGSSRAGSMYGASDRNLRSPPLSRDSTRTDLHAPTSQSVPVGMPPGGVAPPSPVSSLSSLSSRHDSIAPRNLGPAQDSIGNESSSGSTSTPASNCVQANAMIAAIAAAFVSRNNTPATKKSVLARSNTNPRSFRGSSLSISTTFSVQDPIQHHAHNQSRHFQHMHSFHQKTDSFYQPSTPSPSIAATPSVTMVGRAIPGARAPSFATQPAAQSTPQSHSQAISFVSSPGSKLTFVSTISSAPAGGISEPNTSVGTPLRDIRERHREFIQTDRDDMAEIEEDEELDGEFEERDMVKKPSQPFSGTSPATDNDAKFDGVQHIPLPQLRSRDDYFDSSSNQDPDSVLSIVRQRQPISDVKLPVAEEQSDGSLQDTELDANQETRGVNRFKRSGSSSELSSHDNSIPEPMDTLDNPPSSGRARGAMTPGPMLSHSERPNVPAVDPSSTEIPSVRTLANGRLNVRPRILPTPEVVQFESSPEHGRLPFPAHHNLSADNATNISSTSNPQSSHVHSAVTYASSSASSSPLARPYMPPLSVIVSTPQNTSYSSLGSSTSTAPRWTSGTAPRRRLSMAVRPMPFAIAGSACVSTDIPSDAGVSSVRSHAGRGRSTSSSSSSSSVLYQQAQNMLLQSALTGPASRRPSSQLQFSRHNSSTVSDRCSVSGLHGRPGMDDKDGSVVSDYFPYPATHHPPSAAALALMDMNLEHTNTQEQIVQLLATGLGSDPSALESSEVLSHTIRANALALEAVAALVECSYGLGGEFVPPNEPYLYFTWSFLPEANRKSAQNLFQCLDATGKGYLTRCDVMSWLYIAHAQEGPPDPSLCPYLGCEGVWERLLREQRIIDGDPSLATSLMSPVNAMATSDGTEMVSASSSPTNSTARSTQSAITVVTTATTIASATSSTMPPTVARKAMSPTSFMFDDSSPTQRISLAAFIEFSQHFSLDDLENMRQTVLEARQKAAAEMQSAQPVANLAPQSSPMTQPHAITSAIHTKPKLGELEDSEDETPSEEVSPSNSRVQIISTPPYPNPQLRAQSQLQDLPLSTPTTVVGTLPPIRGEVVPITKGETLLISSRPPFIPASFTDAK